MSTPNEFDAEALARALAGAQDANKILPRLRAEQTPMEAGQAYVVQHRVLALRGQAVGGWKVGAKSPTGPIQGAPLPADRVLSSPARLPRSAFASLGLELEIAFRFGRVLEPRRLLVWLANHASSRGIAVDPDMVITTGSYTGIYLPECPGSAVAAIAGLPPLTLTPA